MQCINTSLNIWNEQANNKYNLSELFVLKFTIDMGVCGRLCVLTVIMHICDCCNLCVLSVTILIGGCVF